MKTAPLVLALLVLAAVPVAPAAEAALAPVAQEAPKAASCGGLLCQVLCKVLTTLGRPCPR